MLWTEECVKKSRDWLQLADGTLCWLTRPPPLSVFRSPLLLVRAEKVDAEAESRECDGAEQSIPGWRLRNQELRSAPGPATDRN